ncbi:MAG: hypothetical protein J7M38_05560 [Armatimonadetes bacterium]|nr:hypothetical protein [Armatimonadota bacterium]
MRKTLLVVVVLTVLAVPAMAMIPAAGPASAVAFNPYGWAVTISVTTNSAPSPQAPIWVVIPGGAYPGSPANMRAVAIATTINTLAPLLADKGNVGAINYKYVGDGIGDYVVFVTGVQGGSSIADHKLITIDRHLAAFYGVSRRSLAYFLTCRLRGMAELDSMGGGWNDVSKPNTNALRSPWNYVDP